MSASSTEVVPELFLGLWPVVTACCCGVVATVPCEEAALPWLLKSRQTNATPNNKIAANGISVENGCRDFIILKTNDKRKEIQV